MKGGWSQLGCTGMMCVPYRSSKSSKPAGKITMYTLSFQVLTSARHPFIDGPVLELCEKKACRLYQLSAMIGHETPKSAQ